MYRINSSKDIGTLYQLRNLINRRNITKKPDSNVAASEDFLLTVVEAYIVVAAMEVLEMKATSDTPSKVFFPDGCQKLDTLQKKKILLMACTAIVEKFVEISSPPLPNQQHTIVYTTVPESSDSNENTDSDLVNAYSRNLMSLGLLLMEFNDGIREGDGDRIMAFFSAII